MYGQYTSSFTSGAAPVSVIVNGAWYSYPFWKIHKQYLCLLSPLIKNISVVHPHNTVHIKVFLKFFQFLPKCLDIWIITKIVL